VLLQTELEKPGEWLTYKAIATESKI